MIEQKPPSAPVCWGRQYDDNDKECTNQCEYRLTCKPAFFRAHATQTGVTSLPMYPTQAPPFWQGAAPLPSPVFPFQGTQQSQQTVRLGAVQPPPLPTTFQHLPNPPSFAIQQAPPAPMSAPGAMLQQAHHLVQQAAHSPHFMQYYSPYPGETILQRLCKHLALRLGQVFFHEVSNFLGLWRWPPTTK